MTKMLIIITTIIMLMKAQKYFRIISLLFLINHKEKHAYELNFDTVFLNISSKIIVFAFYFRFCSVCFACLNILKSFKHGFSFLFFLYSSFYVFAYFCHKIMCLLKYTFLSCLLVSHLLLCERREINF